MHHGIDALLQRGLAGGKLLRRRLDQAILRRGHHSQRAAAQPHALAGKIPKPQRRPQAHIPGLHGGCRLGGKVRQHLGFIHRHALFGIGGQIQRISGGELHPLQDQHLQAVIRGLAQQT